MGTIDDILFDRNYSHATFRFHLLNDQPSDQFGPTPVLVLHHVSLLTFVEVFLDLQLCQQNINNDNQKTITLFIADRKMTEWYNQINVIDHNIEKVYIFCDSYLNYLAMKGWNGCYQAKIQDVYLPDTFEYNLLMLGVGYIRKIMPEFQQDRGVYRKFATDAQRLLRALNDYFQDQIDDLDDGTSVQNQ